MRPALREWPLWATTAMLAPLLLIQGRRARAATPRLPEPDGARDGSEGRGPPLRLLILGDSAAAGVGADSQDESLSGCLRRELSDRHRLEWRLLARTGATARDALTMLHTATPSPCDAVLISLGANDATALRSTRRFLDDYAALIAHLRNEGGARLVLASGLPPMHAFPALPQPLRRIIGAHARRLDIALAQWCATQPDIEHLPFGELPAPEWMATDGFHPGPQVYAQWAHRAAQRLAPR
jgi:lysophospholipase L1-like esterase